MNLFLRRGWTLPLLLALFVDNLRGTPVRTAALLAVFVWAAAVLKKATRRPSVPPAFLAFFLWCAAGLLFSVYRAGTLAELSLLAGAAALWAGASVLWTIHPEEKAFFPKALVVLGLVKGATALLFPVEGARAFWDPGEAGTANIALTPMFLVLGALLGLGFARRPGAPVWRGLWLALLAAALWLSVRWNAMAALLGLVLGFPLAAAFRTGRRGWFWAAGAGGLVALGIFFSPSAPGWLRYNPNDPARLERLAVWKDSLRLARAHPWAGTALGTFEQHYPAFKSLPGARTANYAHNDWLQVLVETGLPGAALALFLLGGLLKTVRARGRAAPGAAAGLATLALWASVYFPFRWDPLLFAGALMLAELIPARLLPLSPRPAALLGGAGLLAGAVAFSQGSAQAVERWGGAAWNAGNPGPALERFRMAARLDPLEPRFLLHQVECLRRLDRKAETLPLLEKALRLKPRDVWARRTLAVARFNLEGPEAARETYAPILELAPNVPQFRKEYEELAPAKAVK